MKLWQKIFISSLILIMIAVGGTALAVLNNIFSSLTEQEISKGITNHEYYETSILNSVAYSRLENDVIMLSTSEVQTIIESTITKTDGVIVCSDDLVISKENNDLSLIDDNFTEQIKANEDSISYKTDIIDNQNFILLGSVLEIEGDNYYLYTINYTTDIYGIYNEQIDFIKIFSIIFACIIAFVLLIITVLLFRPLAKLNTTINKIAGGKYDLKISEKGSPEFSKLAKNINIMTTEIEKNITRLEDIANSRTQFINNFAHEMKTPLTSIMCFADVLRIKRNISENERQEYASVIVDEANRMKNLSSKILEIATTNSAGLDLKTLDIKTLVEEISFVMTPIMKQRNVIFKSNFSSGEFTADKELIKSLIFNLLDNSIKASNENEEIFLSINQDEDFTIISVEDFGIGMSKEDLSKINEAFYMVDKSRSRKFGGAGLGLSLCENIVSVHNGTILYESETGKGTVVTIKLPKGGVKIEDN